MISLNVKKNICLVLFALVFFSNGVFADIITKKDIKTVIKITEKLRKLSDNNKIDEISKYYSKDYISYDGYTKDEIIKIFETARELYPESRTKEKILKVEQNSGLIKIYIDETSKTKLLVTGEEAMYADKGKIKGLMTSSANYSMTYKGEEFTVKTTLEVPEDVLAVGSIGHDKIVFPPEKYWDPYRVIDETGVLERVMTANKEGINEYANATFAFVKTPGAADSLKDAVEHSSISGMGFYVKRINMKKEAENEG